MLERADLAKHHSDIFSSALEIALCISGARRHAADFTGLTAAQACLYSLRDINEDLARNIINIPAEEIGNFSHDAADGIALDDLLIEEALQHWYREELTRGIRHLQAFEKLMLDETDRGAIRVVRPVLRGLKRIASRLGHTPFVNLHRPMFSYSDRA